MKAFELINILKKNLNREIQIETREVICDIKSVDVDTFDSNQGPVFVITADD